jgi:DNA-binding CsgD family transcriptional regulator
MILEKLNKETLKRLYITEKKSTTEIAKMFGCTPRPIQERCRKYGIKLRPRGSIIKGLDKALLRELYVKEGKTLREIAKIFGCSHEGLRYRCTKTN